MSSSVVEWFSGKNVFITGATGYMGKVLLVKMLKTIPNIGRVYILCRQKRSVSPQSRVAELSKLMIFKSLREERPEVFKKIIVVEGDVTQPGLGLQTAVKEELINQVNVVFNFAASITFTTDIKTAVNNNTHGTLRLLDLASEMKNLLVFTHLSTAFCHCDVGVVEEKLYNPPKNPREAIKTFEWLDDETAKVLTPKFLGEHPNSYTYSKKLAEGLLVDYVDKFPIVLLRPSIVTPAISEPVPGWVDNLYGPIGILVGAGKGVIRSMICEPDKTAKVIPVDVAINAVIAATYRRAVENPPEKIHVYNVTAGDAETMTYGELMVKGRKIIRQYPFEGALWYPYGIITPKAWLHHLVVFLFQILPAYFIDFLLVLFLQKRFMVRVQNRITLGMKVFRYFTTRPWEFQNDNLLVLQNFLNDEDRETFSLLNTKYDKDEYLKDSILGARVYCMKEPLETLPKARKQQQILKLLDVATKLFIVAFLFWVFAKNFILPLFFSNEITH